MRGDWALAYALLCGLVDTPDADPADLDTLADAAWWLCRVEESIAHRQRAYAGHVAARATAGPRTQPGWCSSSTISPGMARLRRAGWPAPAGTWRGSPSRSSMPISSLPRRSSRRSAVTSMPSCGVPGRWPRSPTARAAPTSPRWRWRSAGPRVLARGEREAGFALVDEAMCAVLAGELSSLFTGWIYCLALPAAIEAADLRRAGEWTDGGDGVVRVAARRDAVPRALPRAPGRGAAPAGSVGRGGGRGGGRACEELLAYDPRVAAEAFYLAGEIALGRGSTRGRRDRVPAGARARPGPAAGLALLRLAPGAAGCRCGAARGAVPRVGTRRTGPSVAAQVEVALAPVSSATARRRDELDAIARRSGARCSRAGRGRPRGGPARRGEPADALPLLRGARAVAPAGLPSTWRADPDADRRRQPGRGRRRRRPPGVGAAARRPSTTRCDAGRRRAAALLATGMTRPGGLTEREVEVLRLVAAGRTNREHRRRTRGQRAHRRPPPQQHLRQARRHLPGRGDRLCRSPTS